jgi:hypothetical protein
MVRQNIMATEASGKGDYSHGGRKKAEREKQEGARKKVFSRTYTQ